MKTGLGVPTNVVSARAMGIEAGVSVVDNMGSIRDKLAQHV